LQRTQNSELEPKKRYQNLPMLAGSSYWNSKKVKQPLKIGKIFEVLNGLGLELHLIKRGDS